MLNADSMIFTYKVGDCSHVAHLHTARAGITYTCLTDHDAGPMEIAIATSAMGTAITVMTPAGVLHGAVNLVGVPKPVTRMQRILFEMEVPYELTDHDIVADVLQDHAALANGSKGPVMRY